MGKLKGKKQKPGSLILGKNDTIKTYLTIDSGRMIPWIVMQDVKIFDTRIFKSKADLDQFNRLRYNVLKLLPYARFEGQRYRQLQKELALTVDRHKQKELINACESQIKEL